MAHEVESLLLREKPAWHNIQELFFEPITNAAEIHSRSGQDFYVGERPVIFQPFPEDVTQLSAVKGYKVLYRTDTNAPLAVVTDDYKRFQNSEQIPMTQRIIDSGHAELEGAGVLRGGKRCFCLFKVKGSLLELAPNDSAELYILQAWGHDGKFGHHTQFTGVRVVCMNTLRAALAGQEAHIRIAHRAGIHEAVEAVTESVLQGKEKFAEIAQVYRGMMKQRCDLAAFSDYVRSVFQLPAEKKITELRAFPALQQAFVDGPGANLDSARGTMWGAYNAITHWIDHTRGRNAENRLCNTWFGEGATLRNRALQVAIDVPQ